MIDYHNTVYMIWHNYICIIYKYVGVQCRYVLPKLENNRAGAVQTHDAILYFSKIFLSVLCTNCNKIISVL